MTPQAYPERKNFSTRGKRDLGLFLEDIFGAIESIEKFSKGVSRENFLANEEKQSAVIRQIEIMGEAVPSQIKEKELVGARC